MLGYSLILLVLSRFLPQLNHAFVDDVYCLFLFFAFPLAHRLPASHDPPLKLYGIPARYANATYSAASKAGELEIVQRDLDAFQNVRKLLFLCWVFFLGVNALFMLSCFTNADVRCPF